MDKRFNIPFRSSKTSFVLPRYGYLKSVHFSTIRTVLVAPAVRRVSVFKKHMAVISTRQNHEIVSLSCTDLHFLFDN